MRMLSWEETEYRHNLERQRNQLRDALVELLAYTRACESLMNASESKQCIKAREAIKQTQNT